MFMLIHFLKPMGNMVDCPAKWTHFCFGLKASQMVIMLKKIIFIMIIII